VLCRVYLSESEKMEGPSVRLAVGLRLIDADILQRKSYCTSHFFEHNVCNNNDFTVQSVKRVFNVSTLRHSESRYLQTTSLFANAVINDTITLRLD